MNHHVTHIYDVPPIDPDEGYYLHASAVNTVVGALLFMGHSTSGKSTISRKLSDQCELIADDVVRIRMNSDGLYQVADGKHRFSSNGYLGETQPLDEYPLAKMTRLFKSPKSYTCAVSQRQMCRYLADALFEVDVQRRNTDLSFRTSLFQKVALLSRSVPGIELYFCLDSSSDDILRLVGAKEETS